MENQRKYTPINCWKCGTMNNLALTQVCISCRCYLKLHNHGGSKSNLHNDSIMDNPVAKPALITAAVIALTILTAAFVVNYEGFSLPDISYFGSSGSSSSEKTEPKKTQIKKVELPPTSWHKKSWWHYIRKYPTARQIIEKNTEVSGKPMSAENMSSIYIAGNISFAKGECYTKECRKKNSVSNFSPVTYNSSDEKAEQKSLELADNFEIPNFKEMGKFEIFSNREGKSVRRININLPTNEFNKAHITETFNGQKGWKRTVHFDLMGKTIRDTTEEQKTEDALQMKREITAVWAKDLSGISPDVKWLAKTGNDVHYVLEEKKGDGFSNYLYFDTVSGYLTRMDNEKFSIFFAGYRDFEGSKIPYKLYFRRQEAAGFYLWIELNVNDWMFNGVYEDSVFEKP